MGDADNEIEKAQMAEDERREALASEDWRGHYMPPTLDASVLFTRTQLLKLIYRKLELDEEIESFKKDQQIAEHNYKEEKKKISQYKKQLDDIDIQEAMDEAPEEDEPTGLMARRK